MGGEKSSVQAGKARSPGSPPHGRGKDRTEKHKQRRRRITPAWAGKSSALLYDIAAFWDHPRMGGEKHTLLLRLQQVIGSPPHGRGKATINQLRQAFAGITPAWAGKSNAAVLDTSSTEDHPRMGGEKCIESGEDVLVSGSPPHGRGKDVPFIGTLAVPGITPAWAGKRTQGRNLEARLQDHPRMGGEKELPAQSLRPGQGSPPHGRGKD